MIDWLSEWVSEWVGTSEVQEEEVKREERGANKATGMTNAVLHNALHLQFQFHLHLATPFLIDIVDLPNEISWVQFDVVTGSKSWNKVNVSGMYAQIEYVDSLQ